MRNKKCKMPDGSFKQAKKGHEKIHVKTLLSPSCETLSSSAWSWYRDRAAHEEGYEEKKIKTSSPSSFRPPSSLL